MEVSLLAVVRLVLRQKLPLNAPDVVGAAISDFLAKDLTLRQACDLSPAGSSALLEFVWARGLRAVESEKWSVGKMLHTEPHYSCWAFTRAMVGAVRRGDLAMVLWLRNRFPDFPIYVEVLGEACKCGRLEVLRLLHSFKNGDDFQWGDLLLNWAASFGHWDVIHWVHEQHPDVSLAFVLEFALEDNNLEEIEWLAAHSDDTDVEEAYLPYSEKTWPIRKDCVRYLVAQGLAVNDVVKGAIQTAADANDLEFVQWLMRCQVSDPLNAYVFGLAHACEHGHIQVVRCLLTRLEELGLRINPSTAMRTAAKSGQLALVQWIYERYRRNTETGLFEFARGLTALEAAAGNGHLEVVQFLHRIDEALTKQKKQADIASSPMCTTDAMDAAAGAGHLAVVRWLHTNRSEGCTTAAMDVAAANGHLDVVKWLHSNRSEGCTSAAMDDVAGREYHESGCRGKLASCCVDKRPESFVEAQITMLEWLRTNRTEGCTVKAVNRASRNRNLKVLQWLRANTTVRPSSPYPMESAASDGRLDIVKWLHGMYPECCTEEAMSGAMGNAAESGHLEVVKWVSSNLPGHNPELALLSAAGYHQLSPTRRQLEVVQHLLPNCAAADVASALGHAMYEMHFEIVLLLHTQCFPALSSDELENAKCKHRFASKPSHSNIEISKWVEENYPFDTESE